MKKVLVTGGAGFIGSHVVDRVIEEGHEVVVIDNLSTGKKENINADARFYIADIRDKDIGEIFKMEKPDIVIHHAAQIDVQRSIKEPTYDGDINIIGTVNLLENCRKYGVDKFIYASSAAVYGTPAYLPVDEKHEIEPISYYGVSKYAPELYIKVYNQLYGIKYTILRYANVYGIRQEPKGEGGVISIFLDKMLKGEQPTIFGDGSNTRDYIYVEDIAEANLKALYYGDNDIFNIGTGRATDLNKLFDIMKEFTGFKGEAAYGDARPGDIKDSCLCNDKAVEVLKWSWKYSIEEGLEKTITYYKEKYV